MHRSCPITDSPAVRMTVPNEPKRTAQHQPQGPGNLTYS